MPAHPVLIHGLWRASSATAAFRAENPATGETFPDEFPTSNWADCDEALNAAVGAAEALRAMPRTQLAQFLSRYAERLELRAGEIVERAHLETALPKAPRLTDVELPRTTGQLRQAAAAVLEGSWALPAIDSKINLRSCLGPIGPVAIFGPNNFPFAFNGVAGGDFAAAIAAGNPVIAKAHPSHPGTTRLLAQEALAALGESGLPPATVQMIYNLAPEDGLRLVADPRLGAVGFTGSRASGMKLKAAADAVGKPIYLEMSSLNPVVILPGALAERGAKIVDELVGSCLAASGQMCTSPGLVFLVAGEPTEQFIAAVKGKLESVAPSCLLSSGVARSLETSVKILQEAGAKLVTGGVPLPSPGYRFANTLLRVSGAAFLAQSEKLQTEAFGNASLLVVVDHAGQLADALKRLEGNLTGSIYSETNGADDALYDAVAPVLRHHAGRFLNDKMPTGVAVSAAMNHGGPFPATGHPGFTAVGIPASLRRFAMLQSYDNVRPGRLPELLRDKNPTGQTWRLIDGAWTQGDITPKV
jgi:NADP-dependent aldehyde dehydrogenase